MSIKKSLSTLQELFADNNAGNISALDLRDGFKTALGSQLVTTVTSNLQLSADDVVLDANTDSGSFTLQLPNVSGSDSSGDTFRSKFYTVINTGSNSVTLSAQSAQLVLNASSVAITPGQTFTVISNGIEWLKLDNSDDGVDERIADLQATSGTWNDTTATVSANSASWAAPTNYITTDSNQVISAGVEKTWEATQKFGAGVDISGTGPGGFGLKIPDNGWIQPQTPASPMYLTNGTNPGTQNSTIHLLKLS